MTFAPTTDEPTMTKTAEDVLADLSRLGVETELRRHAPVTTVAEMMEVLGDVPGAHTKNLFLRDAKKTYFLVSLLHDAKVDLKAMRHLIGARGNLSFASADALLEKLGVTSGAVSPFAIVNDLGREVTVCLQDALLANDIVNFHVLTNTATISLEPAGLDAFLQDCGHARTVFSLTA